MVPGIKQNPTKEVLKEKAKERVKEKEKVKVKEKENGTLLLPIPKESLPVALVDPKVAHHLLLKQPILHSRSSRRLLNSRCNRRNNNGLKRTGIPITGMAMMSHGAGTKIIMSIPPMRPILLRENGLAGNGIILGNQTHGANKPVGINIPGMKDRSPER